MGKQLSKVILTAAVFNWEFDHSDIFKFSSCFLFQETQQSIYLLLSTCDVLEYYPEIIETIIKFVNFFQFANYKVQTEEIIFEKLSTLSELDGGITNIMPKNTFLLLRQFCEIEDVHYR